MRTRLATLVVLVILGASGCSRLAAVSARPITAVPYPAGCADYGMSPRRCDAIVAEAKREAWIDDAQVATIELTSEPTCQAPNPGDLCLYSTAFAANVRFHLVGGTTTDQQIRCSVGGEYTLLCTETPTIRIGGPTMGGYRDVPCADENAGGCATPLPTFEPAAAAAASPLSVPTMDIPIDHLGHYQIEVGRAVLPNGVVTEGQFALANPKTTSIEIDPDSGVVLTLTSLASGGRPFDNYYMHGWHTGTEEVVAALDFDVTRFDPGAVLQVRDLVIR